MKSYLEVAEAVISRGEIQRKRETAIKKTIKASIVSVVAVAVIIFAMSEGKDIFLIKNTIEAVGSENVIDTPVISQIEGGQTEESQIQIEEPENDPVEEKVHSNSEEQNARQSVDDVYTSSTPYNADSINSSVSMKAPSNGEVLFSTRLRQRYQLDGSSETDVPFQAKITIYKENQIVNDYSILAEEVSRLGITNEWSIYIEEDDAYFTVDLTEEALSNLEFDKEYGYICDLYKQD